MNKTEIQFSEAMARKDKVLSELTVAKLIRIVELNMEQRLLDGGYSPALNARLTDICGNGVYFDTDEIQAELELRTGE